MDWKFPAVTFSTETVTFLFHGLGKRWKALGFFTLDSAWRIYLLELPTYVKALSSISTPCLPLRNPKSYGINFWKSVFGLCTGDTPSEFSIMVAPPPTPP